MKDDLRERICNVIKNQSMKKLKSVHLDNLLENCVKYEMGQKPITEAMTALEIAIKVCDQVQKFKPDGRNDYHKSMDLFCKRSRLYDNKPRDEVEDSRR
uniref:Uncharacterized protein n=1 Tax=Romanomermis culicivorax TaxID=13658 RepID=A0A915IN65_ROMCU